MSDARVNNQSSIDKYYYDVPKGMTKEVRAFFVILGGALLGGATILWLSYARGWFHFDSTSTMMPSTGDLEWVGAIVATALASFTALRLMPFLTDAGTEFVSYRGKNNIYLDQVRQIRAGTCNLQQVRALLCKDHVWGDKAEHRRLVYYRNVNLGPHVRSGDLTVAELRQLDAAIEEYNNKLEEIELVEKEIKEPSPSAPYYENYEPQITITTSSSTADRLRAQENEKMNQVIRLRNDQKKQVYERKLADYEARKIQLQTRLATLKQQATALEQDWPRKRVQIFQGGQL